MDLFTLNALQGTFYNVAGTGFSPIIENRVAYTREVLIENYQSLLWTERFIEPGDFRLVIAATRENMALLRPGTLLCVDTSPEPMLIDTRSVDAGMITASGKTLEAYFDQRQIAAMTLTDQPGDILRRIVENMQLRYSPGGSIDGLRIGAVADFGDYIVTEKFEKGGVYSTLKTIATKYDIGMAVYWVRSEDYVNYPGGPFGAEVENHGVYDLVFSTRVGDDKSWQVVFSPQLDNFANIKDMYTLVDSANFVVVYPPSELAKPGELAEDVEPIEMNNAINVASLPFGRRYLEVTLDTIKEEDLEGSTDAEKLDSLETLMREKAKTTLVEKKARRMIDGEITPETQYSYYTEGGSDGDIKYRLGDTITVQNDFENVVNGVVSEYIRTSDATGSRAYPTVIMPSDPIETGPAS